MNINKTKLLENIKDIKSFLNFNLLLCYENLFKTMSIVYNIGFYIITFITIFHIINAIIFFLKKFHLIKRSIKDIIFGIKNYKLITLNKTKKTNKLITRGNLLKNDNNNKMIAFGKKNKKKNKRKKIKKNNKELEQKKIPNININTHNYNNIIIENDNKQKKKRKISRNITYEYNKRSINKKNLKNKKDIEKARKAMKFIEDEINELPYELAKEYDKRKYFEYYISLLKTKHPLIYSFFYNKDYNSRIIKIDLFFVSFAINYTVNALFFDDETMHLIYESKGKFELEYQLPKIIFSSLISMVLDIFLKLLAISNDSIIKFKQNKNINDVDKRGRNLKKTLKLKFILYYIISFIFLLFFWYYISMFGAIYKNTQIHLLKDTLMSFGLSMISPLIIYLFPGLFRIPALSNTKKDRKFLYNFSKVLQIF